VVIYSISTFSTLMTHDNKVQISTRKSEILDLGRLVNLGPRRVQQQFRVALSGIAYDYDLHIGDYVTVLLFFSDDNAKYEAAMEKRKATLEDQMSNWIKTAYKSLSNAEKAEALSKKLKATGKLTAEEIDTLYWCNVDSAQEISTYGGFLKNIRDFLSQYEGRHEIFDLARMIFSYREISTKGKDFSYNVRVGDDDHKKYMDE
jgi:hypothetical protein